MDKISGTLVDPEANQPEALPMSWHTTMAFRALWLWLDGETFEGEVYSLGRRIDAGPKAVVDVRLVTLAFRANEKGRTHPAAGTEMGLVNLPKESLLVAHRDLRASHWVTYAVAQEMSPREPYRCLCLSSSSN